MSHSSSESCRSHKASHPPPILLRALPFGFGLVGLGMLAEGLFALKGGSPILWFVRQEVSRAEFMFLLWPRSLLLLTGGGYLAWTLERDSDLYRKVAVGLPAFLFAFAMVGACEVGYPVHGAWLDAGWAPLVTALSLGTLLFGSGECGRYESRSTGPASGGRGRPGIDPGADGMSPPETCGRFAGCH